MQTFVIQIAALFLERVQTQERHFDEVTLIQQIFRVLIETFWEWERGGRGEGHRQQNLSAFGFKQQGSPTRG